MATASQPQKRRVRKRILIPSVLLALVALTAIWLYWRGTAADTVERNPNSPAEGPVTQLLTQDGHTFVRCAIIVDAPPAAVWPVVTNYDSHSTFVPYIAELSSQKLDDGKVRLTGVAHSRMWGDWPFEIDVTENKQPDQGNYSATWDEPDKSGFAVNRGGWVLKPIGAKQTLMVFTKQAEFQGYPNFLIRNILMDRVGAIVRGMRDEALRRTGA
jgi:hypothetical protein